MCVWHLHIAKLLDKIKPMKTCELIFGHGFRYIWYLVIQKSLSGSHNRWSFTVVAQTLGLSRETSFLCVSIRVRQCLCTWTWLCVHMCTYLVSNSYRGKPSPILHVVLLQMKSYLSRVLFLWIHAPHEVLLSIESCLFWVCVS